MPTDKQRVFVTLHDEETLSILVCEPSSQPIHEALAAYAKAIEDATASVAQVLSQQDWNYLADCLNGCWHVTELSGLSAKGVLRAEAEDAHRLNLLGYKWYNAEGDRGAEKRSIADTAVRNLLLALAGLSEIEAQAVLLAVRHFWNNKDIGHNEEEWWTIRHRLGKE